MITAMLIGLVVLGGSAGDLLITRGMKQLGEISTLHFGTLVRIAGRALSNRYVYPACSVWQSAISRFWARSDSPI